MNVVFVAPPGMSSLRRFVAALSGVGAGVVCVGEAAPDEIDDELRSLMRGYFRVDDVGDPTQLEAAVAWTADRVPVHRVEAVVSRHQLAAAQVRQRHGLPGTSVETAALACDRHAMREALREAGVPVVDDEALTSEQRADEQQGAYDTFTVDGQAVDDWVTRCYPSVLEAKTAPGLSPQVVATNRIDTESLCAEVREVGDRVRKALDITTSTTHVEWFVGPSGVRVSGVACHPQGDGSWGLYAAADDIDVYHEWAHTVVHGRPDRSLSRAQSAGLVALRPEADGVIVGYSGVPEIRARVGEWIVDRCLPPPGTPTRALDEGYLGGAWVQMRHPDYATLRAILDDVGQTLRVHVE